MKKALFICTHNSARSQMAEALLPWLFPEYQAFSAGTEVTRVNPYAIAAMAELGLDLSTHRSKSIEEFRGESFDYVITVCDSAQETCPYYPHSATSIHHSFSDPSRIQGTEEEVLAGFRQVRDQIIEWLKKTFSNPEL